MRGDSTGCEPQGGFRGILEKGERAMTLDNLKTICDLIKDTCKAPGQFFSAPDDADYRECVFADQKLSPSEYKWVMDRLLLPW